MINIVAILSSFYPNLDDLERNTNSYLPWISKLIIWENTPKEDSYIDQLVDRLNSDKIEVRTTGKNEYLAYPFNQCIRWAQSEGYTHVLTMDQDSCFAEGHFEKYINSIEDYQQTNVAVFGPSSNSREQVKLFAEEVDHIFISGAIFPVDTFLEQGGFNEELVIDSIDSDYCFRCKKNNLQTIVFKDIFLQHQIGYRYKHWSGLIIVPYSAQRTYYFLRNTLWLWKQYPQYFTKSYKRSFVKYRIVYRSLKIIFEKETIRKLSAIVFAIWHYKRKKLGRFDIFSK